MSERSPARTVVIGVSIFCLVFSPTLASATEAGAVLSGQVVTPSTDPSLEVLLVDTTSEHLYRGPVDESGHFEISGLPSATYRLAVNSDAGAFVGSAPVRLEAGEEREVRLALERAVDDDDEEGDLDDEDAEDDRKKLLVGLGPWNNPLIATFIVIGGAVLVGWGIEKTTDKDPPVASATLP